MIHIYTDGSCIKNPGPAAYAFVGLVAGRETILCEKVGMWEHSTNQRAELQAIVSSLQWAQDLPRVWSQPANVTVYSDSKYAIACLSEWWPKWKRDGWIRKRKGRTWPIKNLDLIQQGIALQEVVKVSFQWVKGHSGNKWNEYVDEMANRAAARAYHEGNADIGYEPEPPESLLTAERDYEERQRLFIAAIEKEG